MATLTKEMILDPSKITQEVKNTLKGEMKGCKYAVIFLEHKGDHGTRIVENFGCPKIEYYNNGMVQYECVNGHKTKEEAFKDAALLKRVTNKKFTDISVIGL